MAHDQCAHKVGTDSVLLGSWVDCANAQRVLDIGSGSGVISLMIAQRSRAHIDGVEIDTAAASQSKQNVRHSPWSDRIFIHEQRIQDFKPLQPYDLIVTNPPYFLNSLREPDASRTLSRHTDSLSLDTLCLFAHQ